MEEKIEVIQIWVPVKEVGDAVRFEDGQHFKLVALLADGQPIRLAEDVRMEKRYVNKTEVRAKFFK